MRKWSCSRLGPGKASSSGSQPLPPGSIRTLVLTPQSGLQGGAPPTERDDTCVYTCAGMEATCMLLAMAKGWHG